MINLSDLFSEFLQEQRFRNNSARTLEWYHNNVGMFLSWLGSVDVADLTLCNYKEYCNFLLYTYQSHGKILSPVVLIHISERLKRSIITAFPKIILRIFTKT